MVLKRTEVLVVGCGISGSIAALAAARNGAKTLVIDRQGQPGGNIGPGLFGGAPSLELPRTMEKGLPGIAGELIGRCEELSGHEFPHNYFEDSQTFVYVLLKEYERYGVDALFNVYAGDPLMEGRTIRGIHVETKQGREQILADVVIDATGDADVVFRCGAPVDEGAGLFHPGMYFALANVDTQRYRKEAVGREPDAAVLSWGNDYIGMKTNPNLRFLFPYIKRAWEAERFPFVREVEGGRLFADHGLFFGVSGPSVVDPRKRESLGIAGAMVCFRGDRIPTSGDSVLMSRLEVEARKYIYEFAQFARRYVPGCADAYLHASGSYFSSRGGRSMIARKALTEEDVEGSYTCDDAMFEGRSGIVPSNPLWSRHNDYRYSFQFPYRQFLPQNVEGLLATGRACIVQKPQLRMRWQMFLTGEAAGTAAALSVKARCLPSRIDVGALRNILAAQGFPMGTGRPPVNGAFPDRLDDRDGEA